MLSDAKKMHDAHNRQAAISEPRQHKHSYFQQVNFTKSYNDKVT